MTGLYSATAAIFAAREQGEPHEPTLPMAEPVGKFLPCGHVPEHLQPHGSHWSDGGAGRHDPRSGGRCRGLRYLPGLRKQAGSGAGRTSTASSSQGFAFAGRPGRL